MKNKNIKKISLIVFEVIAIVSIGIYLAVTLVYRSKNAVNSGETDYEISLPDNGTSGSTSVTYFWTATTGDKYCPSVTVTRRKRAEDGTTTNVGTYNVPVDCSGNFTYKTVTGTATVGSASTSYNFKVWCHNWTAVSGSRYHASGAGTDGCYRYSNCDSQTHMCSSVETRCCGGGGGGGGGGDPQEDPINKTITVHHYITGTTTQVHDDDTQTKEENAQYSTSSYAKGDLKDDYKDKYEWDGVTPSNASGTASEDITVTYYYKKIEKTVTIHHYVEGTTTQVHGDDTSTFGIGDTYDKRTAYYGTSSLTSPYTNNYEWNGTTPTNASGTISDNVEMTFYYKKRQATITVHHYVENTTTQVHTDDTSTAYYTDSYNKSGAYHSTGELTGNYKNNYEWNGSIPSNATGTVGGNIEISFYYKKRQATLTIHHYIVGSTTKVHADDTSTVYYTDSYDKRTAYYAKGSLISPYTNVYEWNKVTPTGANGTVDGNINITFYYRTTQVVVHHYKEGTSTQVHADDVRTVFYGDSYNSSYYLTSQLSSPYTNRLEWNSVTPTNASGTVNDLTANSGSEDKKKVEIIYYYGPRPATINVQHYEWDGINNTGTLTQVCSNQVIRNVAFGDEYETEACRTPVEYELYKVPTNYKGTIEEATINVTYYYIRKSKLIVNHYEWDGINGVATTRSLCDTIEEKKYYGDTYQTSACPSVPTGYKLVSTPSNANGTIRSAEVVVNYYYNREGILKVYHYLWDGFNNIETNDIVCPTEESTYSFGQNYTSSRCNPGNGYRYYKVEDNPEKGDMPTGIITKFDTVVKYYYIHTGTLTVHHYRWDMDNNRGTVTSVYPDQVTNNLDYGRTYTTSPRDLTADDLSLYMTSGDPANGRINKPNTNVIYYYAPIAHLTVHHYLDNSTTSLCTDLSSTINYNENYNAEACQNILNNYNVKRVVSTDNSSNISNQIVTGTMKDSNVVITYYYTLKPSKVVVHHYKWNVEDNEPTTNKICEDVTINSTYTGTYNTDKCNNLNDNSYKFMKVESTDPNTNIDGSRASGTLNSDTVTISYYYDYKPATVTVHHYVNDNTIKVHSDEVINTTYNVPYETNYLTPDKLNDTYKNWYIYINRHTGDSVSGNVNKDNIDVIYYYDRMESTVTVHHYIKGTTTKLAEDEVMNLHYHDSYTTSRKAPNELSNHNYQYESVSGDDPNGTVNKDTIEVTYYYSPIPSKLVTHHYKEGTTNPICDDVTSLNVLYGDTYETHPCENLPDLHHEFKSVFSNDPNSVVNGTTVTGTYNQNEVVVIYYYGLKDARVVTHHYEKGTENKVHEDDILNKKHLDLYTTSNYESNNLDDNHRDWYYYIGETAGDQPNGVIEKDLIEVIYYYDKKPSTLTVHHYIEGTTTKLADDETFDYKYHDNYETHPKSSNELSDTDYIYKNTGGDPVNGRINKDNVDVIYYYKLKPSKVTVHYYVEGTETKLCEDIVSSKVYKDEYHSRECDNLNDNAYQFKEVISDDPNSTITGSNVDGIVKQDEITINYIYELKPATVTVHYYVEGTETKLCEDVSLNKKYKDNYSATPCTNLNDNDYKYKEVVTNDPNSNINGSKVTGTVNQDEVIINYFYELKPANVVVHHYIEGTTTKLCEDIDTMYKMKDHYDINLCTNLSDNAYKFKEVRSTDISSTITGSKVEGTVTNNFEITYYYDLKSSQIKVHYLELDTHNKVSDDVIHSGKVYDEVTISELEIEGYRLVKKPDNETITFTVEDQDYTYLYTKLKFDISVDILEGEGTVEGNEIIEYGDDSTPDKIVITPHPEWEINMIIVDGEEIEITDPDGMILPNFKKVVDHHKIEVSFTEKPIPVPITGSKTKLIIASIVLTITVVFTIFKFKIFKKKMF